MAKKEGKGNGNKLWSRFWAEQGLAVVHVDNLKVNPDKPLESMKMRIEESVYITKKVDGAPRQLLIGIKCHWFTESMEIQRSVFHSCELIPFDIAKEGLIKVQEWLDRKI